MSNLYDEKIKMLTNAANHVNNPRMPIIGNAQTWAISYAKATAQECLDSYERESEIYSQYLKDIYFDGVLLFGVNRPLNTYKHLGFKPYFISNDNITLQCAAETTIVKEDEIDKFIKDPIKFFKELAVARRYPMLTEMPKNIDALKCAFADFMAYIGTDGIKTAALKKCETPLACNSNPMGAPLDQYFGYRGWVNGLADLRRRPQQVLDACAAITPLFMPANEQYDSFPWIFDPIVSATYLNQKQFEKFFAPSYKQVCDAYINKGAKIIAVLEGKWGKQKYEFYNDFEKNTFLTWLEDDDPYDVQRDIGEKVSIGYPYPVQMLKSATKEENITHAKKAIDKLGTKGTFFLTDKGLMSAGDARWENYAAVSEVCRTYFG